MSLRINGGVHTAWKAVPKRSYCIYEECIKAATFKHSRHLLSLASTVHVNIFITSHQDGCQEEGHQEERQREAYSCVRLATMCVLGGTHGAPVAFYETSLGCYGEPTVFLLCAYHKAWATAHTLCMHKVHGVALRPRRTHGIQWRCQGDASAL